MRHLTLGLLAVGLLAVTLLTLQFTPSELPGHGVGGLAWPVVIVH